MKVFNVDWVDKEPVELFCEKGVCGGGRRGML